MEHSRCDANKREGLVIRWMAWAIAGLLKSRALLVAENLCLRQQLVVLQRRQPRPRLLGADRRFWILARQWFSGWRDVLLVVRPETVLRWHREGWRVYWRWRSRPRWTGGRRPIAPEVRALIRQTVTENPYGRKIETVEKRGVVPCETAAIFCTTAIRNTPRSFPSDHRIRAGRTVRAACM